MLDLVPTPCKCVNMYDSLVPRPPPRFSSLGMRLYTYYYYLQFKIFYVMTSKSLRFICRVEFRRELKVERDRELKMERFAAVPHKAANTSLTRNSPSTEVDTSTIQVSYKPQSSCKWPPPYVDSSVIMCGNHSFALHVNRLERSVLMFLSSSSRTWQQPFPQLSLCFSSLFASL